MNARQRLAETRRAIAERGQQIRDSYAKALATFRACHELVEQRELEVSDQVQRVADAGDPASYAPWDSSAWHDWQPSNQPPDEVRLARFTGPRFFGRPATIALFRRPVLLVTDHPDACRHAHTAMRNLALRIVASGANIVTHLIDPFQLGHGFRREAELPGAAPRALDALANLVAARDSAHADSLAGPNAPRHVVLVLDYPRGFNHQGVEILNSLPQLPNTQLILHHDTLASEPGVTGLDLRDVIAVDITEDGTAVGCWGYLAGSLDEAAPSHLVEQIAAGLRASQPTSGTGWADINPTDPSQWWGGSARREIVAQVGVDKAGRPIRLSFGMDANGQSNSHLVIGGATRSGKSTLLHTLITSLATRYSPDEVQFLLVDGRGGAEMQAYRELPHAQAVSIHTPNDLAAGIIQDLGNELRRRAKVLVDHGVSSFAELPAGVPNLPRLVVVIDEYHVYLNDLTNPVGAALVEITKQGAAAGINLVLASQSFHGAGAGNRGTFYDNIQTRVALQLPGPTVDSLTQFDADARRLIKQHCRQTGDVVVHSGGAGIPDVAGRVSHLQPEQRNQLVAELAQRDSRRPHVLDGNQPPSPADSRALAGLAKVPRTVGIDDWARRAEADGGLGVSNWAAQDLPAAFLVGRSLSIHGSAFALLRRVVRHNIAVVCDSAEILTGVLQTGLASVAASTLPAGCRIWVLSQERGRGVDSWRGALTDRLGALLDRWGHEVRSAAQPARAVELVEEALAELERRSRLGPDEQAEQDTLIVAAAGLERLAEFNAVEGRFETELSAATDGLRRLAEKGPSLGIHLVLGASSRDAWEQVWPGGRMQLFNHRFYSQLSELDAQRLFNDLHASEVEPGGHFGPRRMGYTDAAARQQRIFLPYATGSDLDQALTEIERS